MAMQRIIGFRADKRLCAAIDRAVADDDRSVSDWLRTTIRAALRRRGLLYDSNRRTR